MWGQASGRGKQTGDCLASKWTAWRVGSLCGLLMTGNLLAASCARVLGDVIVVEGRPLSPDAGLTPDGIGGGFTPGGSTTCEAGGQLRCNGEWLEVCVRLGTDFPLWRHLEDCKASDRCVGDPTPHCLAQSCSAGEAHCEGATPFVCNAARDGWEALPPCVSAAYCSSNPASCAGTAPCCLQAPCQAGEMRCNQGEMQRCRADQTDWDTIATCETPDLCLAGLGDCGGAENGCSCRPAACQQNESRCTGTALERCNAGRTDWEPVSLCATAALCEQGRALVPAACVPPQCDLGSHICTPEGSLKGCRVDRTGYDDQQTCEGPQFCDASGGKCNPVACEAGDRRCNGAQIEVCLDDRTGFRPDGMPCATAALCNDSSPTNVRCDPPACATDSFSCFGGVQLQGCNGGRTAFEPVGLPCTRPDLCSADRRRCDFCVPGRQECNPTLNASRVCSITGNFFGPETPCPLGCNGPVGQCVTCDIGSYRCNGGVIARCNDGRSFTPLNRGTDCSANTQFSCNNIGQLSQAPCGAAGCNPTFALCNECAGTQRQCTGAASFRQCAGGAFGAARACAAGLTCSGAGNCSCSPGTPHCADDTLEFCNALGTGFVGGAACDDDVLLVCDGGELTRVQCSSADDCDDSNGITCD
jgi:hypothetical protein